MICDLLQKTGACQRPLVGLTRVQCGTKCQVGLAFEAEAIHVISRRFLLGMLIASLFVSSSVLFAQSRALKKVQVGVPAISMGNIIIYFTKEAKIYEKYG